MLVVRFGTKWGMLTAVIAAFAHNYPMGIAPTPLLSIPVKLICRLAVARQISKQCRAAGCNLLAAFGYPTGVVILFWAVADNQDYLRTYDQRCTY